MKKTTGTYIQRDLIESPAFRRLSATAIRVLLAFYLKQRKRPVRSGKRKEWITTNGHELSFTYAEAGRHWGIRQGAFREAIDRLVAVGFLDIQQSGAGLYKSATVYGLSERWRKYGTPDFEHAARPRDPSGKGFQRLNAKPRTD